MSFDIWFIKFSKGAPCDLPREPIRALLNQQTFKSPSEDFYDIDFPDGSHIEFSADGLSGNGKFDSACFYLRSLSFVKIDFVFETAKATGCVLIPTMEKNPCVLVDPAQRSEMPADFDLPQIECASSAELMQLIEGGFDSWAKYRDQILGRNKPPDSNPS